MATETIILNVTTTQDQNDGSNFRGLSLRDAILIANADPRNHYQINLPAGVYDLTIKNVLIPPIVDDTTVDQATLFRSRLGTGDLDIIGNITIIGEDPENTIINAGTLREPIPVEVDPENPLPPVPPEEVPTIGDRIFDVLSGETSGARLPNGTPINGNLVVENVTLRNGSISVDNIDTVTKGGAVNIEANAKATFRNTIIENSNVNTISVADPLNLAEPARGGGINNDGELTLDNAIIRGNRTNDDSTTTINGGAGIYNTGILNVRNSAIINNLATGKVPPNPPTLDITKGGGLFNEAGGVANIVNTTISGNRSAALAEGDQTQGTPTGFGEGGGIFSEGSIRIINSTIADNFARVGAGIYSETVGANTIVYNSIVAQNRGSNDIEGIFDPRSNFNLIGNGNGIILDGQDENGEYTSRNRNIVGGVTNPLNDSIFIGPLQNNGGFTPTHALLTNSIALNRGDNGVINFPVYFPDSPALDQRGSERISNGITDIGAYELFVNSPIAPLPPISLPEPITGQTIQLNVNTFQDQNDGSYRDGLSLRDAILIANSDLENNYIINLPAGTYNLTIKNSVLPTLDQNIDSETLFRSRFSTGDLDIIGNITIIGESPENTIINAGTLRNPIPPQVDPNNPFPDQPPIGVPTIGDRIFDVLSSQSSGAQKPNGTPVNGNLLVQNVTLQNGTVSADNIDTISNGGAVKIELGARANFVNSVIADSVTDGQGGGINNNGELLLDKVIVRDNNSGDNAGGIYNTGTLTIRNSTISGNIGDAGDPRIIEGGGGGILNEVGATLTMVNSTVSGNRSAGSDGNTPPTGPGDGGGGILSRGITRIINSTIVNNFAQVGSGIYSETTSANTILFNTIVANNQGSPDLDGFFDLRSASNVIGNANGSILDQTRNNIIGGNTTVRRDLGIDLVLRDNGGATPTHALLDGSIAIDAGDNSITVFPVYFPDSPPLDQRGSERISNGRVDIGAYEVFVPSSVSTGVSDNSTSTNTNTSTGVNNTGSTGETPSTNNPNTSTTGVNSTGSTGETPSTNNPNTSTTGVNNTGSTGETPSTNNPNTSTTGVNSTGSTGETPSTNNPDTSTTGVNSTGSTGETPSTNNPDTSTTGVNNGSLTQESSANTNSFNIPNAENILNEINSISDNNTGDSLLNTPVFRFQNSQVQGTYLYVTEGEAPSIRNNFSSFKEEGLAFNVGVNPSEDLMGIYRFRNNQIQGTYLYVGAEERQAILQNNSSTFVDEGLAFYVYGADANKGEDIFRFQSLSMPGTYLFVKEEEKNNILNNFSSSYVLEGVAFEVG